MPRILYNVAVMAIVGVSGWVMFYFKYDDLTVNTDVLLHAVCTIHTLYLYVMYLMNRHSFNEIYDAMNSRLENMSGNLPLEKYKHIWDSADYLSLFLIRSASYLCIVVFSLYIYNANLFSSKRKLIYPVWVPFSLDNSLTYYVYAYLQVNIFAYYTIIHVSGQGIAIGGAHYIGASLDVLGAMFKDLSQLRSEVLSVSDTDLKNAIVKKHDFDFGKKLKWCVKTHTEILRIVKHFRAVYESIHAEVLLSCVALICFGGFQTFLALEEGQYKRVSMVMGMGLLFTFHLFFFCYAGQHIYNKAERLRLSLYLSDWQDQDLQFRRSLAIMLTTTVKPVTISFKGVFDSSMSSFAHGMRTAFSYVNILLILRDINRKINNCNSNSC